MSAFLNRSKRSVHLLEWRVRILSVAIVFTLVGIYFEERWMTGTAIVVLITGMCIGFTSRGDSAGHEDDGDEELEADPLE